MTIAALTPKQPSHRPQRAERVHKDVSQSVPLLILGETIFRGSARRFGLLPADRLRHLHLLGKTGSGKSTLLATMMLQDLAAGRGFGLIDPHGDLAHDVLARAPRHRLPNIIHLTPSGPITLNPFRLGPRAHPDRSVLSSALIAIFESLWSDSWGPRLEHLLRAGTLAVSYHPEASLELLAQFVADESVRTRILTRVPPGPVKRFWEREFASYSARLKAEAMAPLHNKLGALVMQPRLRRLVGGTRSGFDPVTIIASAQVLIVEAPAADLGDDGARLFGALVFSLIQQAAWQRPARPDSLFALYTDEVQRFVTKSFGTVLAEARKFGLALIVSHQGLYQLGELTREAILSNAGNRILFRLGGDDAARFAAELHPHVTREALLYLGRAKAVMSVLARGHALAPIFANTYPMPRLR